MSSAAAGDTSPSEPLQPGTPAPDFSLPATPDQFVTLAELHGPVVLVFYPADWSPVCGDELSMFEAARNLFSRRGAQLLGISVDGPWCHVAFKADRKLEFPLLADFHPKGEVARAYGVYRPHDGTTERALFVLDGQHDVAWSYVSPIGVSPGVDGALAAVEALP
ncbi:MAG: redoxin domain-containing protein [Acidimicrobiales bacterium]|jgi:peroxiredoxin